MYIVYEVTLYLRNRKTMDCNKYYKMTDWISVGEYKINNSYLVLKIWV